MLLKAIVGLAIGAPIAFVLAPSGYALERFHDAAVYYRAGRAHLAGVDPYVDLTFRQWPLVAAICAPLALLPERLAGVVVSSLSSLAGLVGFYLLRLRLADHPTAPRLWWAAVALGPPFLTLFYLGQMTGFCFAGFCAGLWLLDRRPWLAGVAFALMGAKPHLVLLALPALLGGPLAALIGFVLASLLWPLGSLAVAGPGGLVAFGRALYTIGGLDEELVGVPVSTLLPAGPARTVVELVALALIVGLLAALTVLRLRGRRLAGSGVEVATALILVGLPYARMYEMLFATPLMLRLGTSRATRSWLLALAWWLLPLLSLALLSHGGGGLASLAVPAAVAWRVTRAATPNSPSAAGSDLGDAASGAPSPRSAAPARA
ncbi:MAG TPA: glycosyltransferase family 87 protein [Chloroflexota bacterium]|nr:glycosyltransferase family 87 protein [Chloroflexota bacterium]